MLSNRSIPHATVIPVLAYPEVHQAADWLCRAFGFTVRLRIDGHRVQLNAFDAAVTIREMKPQDQGHPLGTGVAVMVRVEDADAHCANARRHGAAISQEPTSFPYGERQYQAADLAGYTWIFTQSVADVAPEQWGGVAENL